MTEPTKHYDIALEINGGVGFTVRRSASPGVKPRELGQGASQDIGGALCAIEQVLGTDAGARSDGLFSSYFSDAERALLVYALGRVASLADRDVLTNALQKLGVRIEVDPVGSGQESRLPPPLGGDPGICSVGGCLQQAVFHQDGACVCRAHLNGPVAQ